MHAQLRCPRCGLAMLTAAAPSGTLHGCTRCGGVWVDRDTAGRLTSALDARALALADQAAQATGSIAERAAIRCPACGAEAQRHFTTYGRIEVDTCAPHGTWFDRGELGAALRALAPQRDPSGWDTQSLQREAATYAGAGAAPRVAGPGVGVAVGAAALGGVALVGGAAAAYGVASAAEQQGALARAQRHAEEHGGDYADAALEAGDAVDLAADGASTLLENAGDVAEAGGSLFGGLLEVLGSLSP